MKLLIYTCLFVIILFVYPSCYTRDSSRNNVSNVLLDKDVKPESGISCEQMVKEILVSSPRFIELTNGLSEKIIANGGLGYLVIFENSADSKLYKQKNKLNLYEYTLRENYSDRATVIARFLFDPFKLQLYEENTAELLLNKIEFDSTLLAKFINNCD